MDPKNQDLIQMHLEEFIRENPGQNWHTVLTFCLGYYNMIDLDILKVVRKLQLLGRIE